MSEGIDLYLKYLKWHNENKDLVNKHPELQDVWYMLRGLKQQNGQLVSEINNIRELLELMKNRGLLG